MQRVKLSLACLLCVSWVCSASAQQQPVVTPQSQSGVAALQQFSGSATFRGTYFDIRTMTGDGVGYQHGYTQIGATLPTWFDDNSVAIPTARVIVTDVGRVGANGGGIYRRYSDDLDRIFGANAWFDYDQSINTFNYKQFGFGFETLGQWWDARSNFYVPTGNNNGFVQALSLSNNPVFLGNTLSFLGQGQFEQALQGGDFEFGMPLSPYTPWLRGYAGMYYYNAKQDSPVGFRGRLEAWVSNDLSLAVNVTQDQKFGTNVNAVVDWRFSGWMPTRYFPQWTTRERMLMPVQRNWRIATGLYTQEVAVPALNCNNNNNPYFVVWVDSSNPNPGNGTVVNPYSTLPASVPGADLILVRRGDTSIFNPLTGSITLTDNQQLLGEGCAHQIMACATFGNIKIGPETVALPGFVDNGNSPYLSSAGNIITIANNNVVSGFNLINAGGYAITNNPASGSNSFALSCLNVVGNNGGIFLSNASGMGSISHVNLLNNPTGGINIAGGTGALTLTVSDVNSASLPAGVQSTGIAVSADVGTVNVSFANVNADRNATGISLAANNNATLVAAFDTVTANNNTGNGIQISGGGSHFLVQMVNTTANGNGGDGITGNLNASDIALNIHNVIASNNALDNVHFQLLNSTIQATFASDIFNKAGDSGLVFQSTGGGGTIGLTNVVATGNTLDGLSISSSALSQLGATVSGSAFNNNGRDAIRLSADTASLLNFQAQTTLANNSGEDGFHFDVLSNGVLNAKLTAVNLTNSGRNAVYGNLNQGTADINLTASRGSNSGADGMFLQALNQSLLTVSVLRGDFSNSGQTVNPASAIQIIADNSNVAVQTVNTALDNTVIGGPQDDGLNIRATNNAVVLANLTSSDLSNNANHAIDIVSNTGSQVTVNLSSSNGNNSGSDGILFQALNSGSVVVTANQSNFDRSGGNGINGFLNNSGTGNFNFLASSVSFSGANGMLISADNNSTFTALFDGGNFTNSGQNLGGLGTQDANNLTADHQSTINVTLANTPSGNVPTNTTQQRSLFALASHSSTLIYTDTDGDMSNNTLNAINANANSGSTVQIDLTNTLAQNSGQDGYLFNVNNATLMSTVTNGSFSNSGAGLVTGSAVNGTISNGGTAQLTFSNTTSNNAYNNGLFITATGGSTFVGSFDASTFNGAGLPGGVPTTAGDAMLLNADNSIINVTMTNLSTGDSAGGDGLAINAVNGSNVLVTDTNGSFSNEGQFNHIGAGVHVTANNSTVQVNLTNTFTDNQGTNTTQGYGLLFNLANDAKFVFNDTNGDLSSNRFDGINGTAAGTGTVATLTLSNTLVDTNGFNGASFNFTSGSTLNFLIPGGGSISTNGGYGVFANVDGAGTVANFDFTNVLVNFNGLILGGDGFNANVTNGGLVVASFTGTGPGTSTIDSNANRGVNVFLDNGTSFYTFNNTNVDSNGNEGLLMNVAGAASQLVVTATNGTSFTGNGVSGTPPNGFDNVNGQISGGKVDLLFDAVNADSSTRSGFNFDVSNATGPTTFVVQLNNGVSASNNSAGNGVRLVAAGPTTKAALLMRGANVFDNNGGIAPTTPIPGKPGSGVYFQADNVQQAAVRFSGSSDNNGNLLNPTAVDQDGLTVAITNAQFAAVEVDGPGTINNNVQDGIDVRLTNVTNLQTLIVPTQIGPQTVQPLTFGNGLTTNGNGGNGTSVVITGPTAITGGIVFDGLQSNNNALGDGLKLKLDGVTGTPDLTITNGQFSGNGGNGIDLVLNNTPLNNVTISNNQGGGLAGGTLNFSMINLIWTTLLNNNSSAGLDISKVMVDITPTGQGWRPDLNPFSPGRFQPQNGSDVTTGLTAVNGHLITAGTNPLQDNMGNVLPNGGVPPDSQTLALDFNSFNPGDQLNYDLAHSIIGNNTLQTGATLAGATGTVRLADGRTASGVFTAGGLNINQILAATSGGIGSNGLDGIHIEQTNSSFNSLTINNNGIAANGNNGINFAVTQNSNLTAPSTAVNITNNDISSNGKDGIHLINPQTIDTNLNLNVTGNTISSNGTVGVNLQLTAPITTVNTHFEGNTINSNGAQGVNLVMNNGIALTADFVNNTSISSNGAQGVNVQLSTNGSFTSNNFYGNTINNNAGMGVHLTVPSDATFTWQLGDNTQARNFFNGNTDAGVGIESFGVGATVGGTLVVQNSTFDNNVNGNNVNFHGDGLYVLETGTTVVTGSISNSEFSNNGFNGNGSNGSGAGVKFTVTGNLGPVFSQLNNFVIGGPTAADGNTMSGNSGNGIELDRTANGEINNMTIAFNTASANRGNGLYILAANENRADTYTINNNDFSGNVGGNGNIIIPPGNVGSISVGNGILFDERADADIIANLDLNTINNNANNGIQLVESVNAASDSRSLAGTWTRNTITGNNNNGISLNGVMAGLIIGDPTLVGPIPVLPNSLGNIISDNVNGSGIRVTGAGTLTISTNLITGNGNVGQLGTANEDAGIQMAVAPFSAITIVNNDISFNNGDGVQWGIAQGFSGFFSSVAIQNNNISNNAGRGIDVINRANNFSQVDITGNFVNSNLLEGVYIVNTASPTQDQFSSSTAAMAADGSVTNSAPILQVRFFNNEVMGNGTNSTNTATGLVVKVGTSNGTNSPFDNGGFASTGGVLAVGQDPFSTSPQRGGVTMTADQNTFSGNFGDDIKFQSFVSTGNPNTGTTWDATTFDPTGYQSDPLARLDLWFRQNTFDAQNVDNADGQGVFSRNPSNVAFYNNPADGVFKSRLNTATPPGPYTNAGRARNAQRQAARIPNFTAPAGGPFISQFYLYPGMGSSTFRVSTDSDPTVFIPGFNVDLASPVTNTTQDQGFFMPGPAGNGEMPFGWGQF